VEDVHSAVDAVIAGSGLPLLRRHESCVACAGAVLRPLPEYRRVELVQCSGCGLVFSPRVPSIRELVEHYDGYPRDTGCVSPVSERRRSELLSRFSAYRQTGRLLDVGCGVGDLLNQARAIGWQTHGTEYTDGAVEICRGNGHSMRQGPLDALHYDPESFDVIVYTEVVEHISNHREEFDRVRALLRPGGMLYVTTPNFDSLSRRVLGEHWNVIQYPEHLVYFTPRTLRTLMEGLGFTTIETQTTGFSISRWRASRHTSSAAAEGAAQRSTSEDEALRRAFERPLLRRVKASLNGVLSALNLGDTIKAEFLKPTT
jgi:2-polyprenyl-3-methyl-5-hydroxy-6-metoxy-1,4-benzoquinol methylase